MSDRCARATLLLLIVGCSSHRPGGADVQLTPACGDGILQQAPATIAAPFEESCDDGEVNGTGASICTNQCQSAAVGRLPPPVYTYLGLTAREGVQFRWQTTAAEGVGIAFSNYDSSGVHIAWTAGRTASAFMVANPPVALSLVFPDGAFINGAPAWIEGPSAVDGSFHMYFADLDNSGTSMIHEVPYPFVDGTHPVLLARPLDGNLTMVIDQSGVAPYDLLVAVLRVHSATSVETTTLRLPSAGRVRGAIVPTLGWDYVLDPSGAHIYWRVVQFFDDTLSYVSVEHRESYPTYVEEANSLREFARGDWPTHVIAGTIWPKGRPLACGATIADPDHPTYGWPARLTHPTPVMVLTDQGDLYAWQFDGTAPAAGELPLTAWAHVAPGSVISEGGFSGENVIGMEVLAPTGSLDVLVDGDCEAMTSRSLRSQHWYDFPAWSSAVPVTAGPGAGSGPVGMILDTGMWTN